MRVIYKGHISEVQILVNGLYQLKGDQTPLYNLARTIGLVGPLSPDFAMLDGRLVVIIREAQLLRNASSACGDAIDGWHRGMLSGVDVLHDFGPRGNHE